MDVTKGRTTIRILQGDITELDTDVIVNPANDQLILGGGVAGAIRRRGGPTIQEECNRIGFTPVGSAAVTGGGDLNARYVIHAVGPRQGEGREDEKLRSATQSSLERAEELNLKSIALPAISTGIFGFPMDRAAEIMVETVKNYLEKETDLELIVFCLFDREAYDIFSRELSRQFPAE